MTEYTDKVDLQRLQNEAEEWGKKVAYIHYNNGIEEVKYNNGKIVHTNVKTGNVTSILDRIYPERSEPLIDKFQRTMLDWK